MTKPFNVKTRPVIVHIASGDRWAGAESQIFCSLRELNKYFQVHAILMNEGELANKLRQNGIDTLVFNESELSFFQLLLRVRKALLSLRPQIVHTHRKKEHIIGSIANLLASNAKCLRTVHGAPEFTPKGIGKIANKIDFLCGNYLQERIIAVSSELKERLRQRFRSDKVITVVNGLDPEGLSQSVKPVPLAPDTIHIGIAGRLEPVKRVDIFLKMSEILIHHDPRTRWQFHILGGGSLEADLRSLSTRLSSSKHTLFHGHVDNIYEYIKGLDVLVMCSDHEGLPMAALESLALGTPVVAHNVGGLTELLATFPDWLVDNHNPESYAAAVEAALKARSEPIVFPNKFHISRSVAQLRSVYESLFQEIPVR